MEAVTPDSHQQPEHPLDVCYCGDYRKDHKDGKGICMFTVNARGDGHHGAGRCDKFVLLK